MLVGQGSLSKDHRLQPVNSKTSFSHRSGGCTSTAKGAAALLFPGASAWCMSGRLLRARASLVSPAPVGTPGLLDQDPPSSLV